MAKGRVLFFLCMILLSRAYGQNLRADSISKAWPNEPYVYLEQKTNATLSVVNGKIRVIQHLHEEIMILKNNFNTLRNRKIHHSTFVQVKDLKAELMSFNGKKYKRSEVLATELATESQEDDNAFYDGAQYYNIKFNSAKEGDIIVIDYDEVFAEPRFFDIFFASRYSPVINSEMTVTYPPALISLKVMERNNQKLTVVSGADSSKKLKTLFWKFGTVPPLKDENADPGYKYKASYVLMSIENYHSGDSIIGVGGSLKNLYSWYTSLTKNVDATVDPDLKLLTDSLTKPFKTDKEKLQAIFYWVQNKIAYLAYEDGLGGYVPRESALVWKRRFGDCKDMANLLYRMGRLAGLPVYPAWIGTRDIPYQFTEFPAPFCANHMIAAFISKTDTLFMDATGKKHPFGLPTSMIQGKEALIGLDSSHFLIAKVPYTGRDYNSEHDSIVLSIAADNTIKGFGYYTLRGYVKVGMDDFLEKKSYSAQKNYLRSVLEKGNNKFRLDTFYVMHREMDEPLVIYYSFSINDYVTLNERTVYLNANFLKNYFDAINTSARKNGFSFSYKSISKLSVNIDLQNGFSVGHLPENAAFNNDVFGFDIHYSATDKQISFSNSIFLNSMDINESEFNRADQIISQYKKNKMNLISLTRK